MGSKKRSKVVKSHPKEVYSIEQKRAWFAAYSAECALEPQRTISDFLKDLSNTGTSVPSSATMGRIVQTGLKDHWDGWEEINGRCPSHPNVLLKAGTCEACYAEEVLRLKSPKSLASTESEPTPKAQAIAEKFYPTLPPDSPFRQFLASDLPVKEYVNFFSPRIPFENTADPEVYNYEGHDDADE